MLLKCHQSVLIILGADTRAEALADSHSCGGTKCGSRQKQLFAGTPSGKCFSIAAW